jgi:hypothetical protein
MKDEITTTDLGQFGWRERKMAEELLRASREQGFPEEFDDDETTIMMNRNSGSVFFTNSNYDTCMMNGDKLEMWWNCPVCGHEGFPEDMPHGEDDPECQRYLRDIGVIESKDED